MEVGTESKMKPAYYFSWPDDEILDERTLGLSCDDDTWLYKVEQPGFNGYYQLASQQNMQLPSGTVAVDSRTFTRRKHSYQRPSLESVMESPFSNRSSLGILSTTKLNDTVLMNCITPVPVNQEKISSNFTASDKKPLAARVFKLESPLLNPSINFNQFPNGCIFERKRHDSELSDFSIPPSLQNSSQFDKNEVLTNSLINFLEKQDNTCPPPMNFQDDKPMTESLVSLSENENNVEIKDEAMTESLVNFLAPVDCKPPRGFEDNEMCSSIVNIEEKDSLPGFDMPNSLIDYLDDVKIKPTPILDNTSSNEEENIPPGHCADVIRDNSNQVDHLKAEGKLNSTFEIVKHEVNDTEGDLDISPNITFTNNVNITRTKKDIVSVKHELNITKPLNSTLDKERSTPVDNVELNLKMRALNNRDLNVNQKLNDDDYDLSSTKSKVSANNTRLNGTFTKSDLNLSRLSNNTKLYGTYKKSNLNGTFDLSHQIPQRNSTFNTTFTKLDASSKELTSSRLPTYTKSSEKLNGMEDDQNSSASDSSFSSGSTKPRSVDELRTIAQQQESSLVHASTPTGTPTDTSLRLSQLDLELSPIRRSSPGAGRNSESRSAHCSPVRNPHPRSPLPHPINRLHQTQKLEMRRQTLQASSLSNLAKPRESGLRMPLPITRMSVISKPEPRPITPLPQASAQTAIPRPQASRLPMPRFRTSGIPTMKRGGHH